MKKGLCIFAFLCLFSFYLFADESTPESPVEYIGVEIENTIGAVKAANPGDFIVLKSGKKYVLTKEEIDILQGNFDFDDLSEVKTEFMDDGTEIKTISEAHVVYAYPDGQFSHLLKTGASFSAYMRYIESKYHIALYVDYYQEFYDYAPIDPKSFNVFRAVVEIQEISDGYNSMEGITISAYNYQGKNIMMKYCSEPDMFWGYIPQEGSYRPTGESRQLEFDIE